MTIALFGDDLFAATAAEGIIEAGHTILLLISSQPASPAQPGKLLAMAGDLGIKTVFRPDPNDAELQTLLKQLAPDLILSVHLRKILAPETFRLAGIGALNVHPSLLPKYGGLSPMEQAILHGDPETGITVHYIDEQPDGGDIILQEKLWTGAQTDLFALQRLFLPLYRRVPAEAMQKIATPGFRPLPQTTTGKSWFGPVTATDRRLVPGTSIAQTARQIRAFSKPGKGAVYQNMVIWRARHPEGAQETERCRKFPDVGIHVDEPYVVFRAKDGVLISDDFDCSAR